MVLLVPMIVIVVAVAVRLAVPWVRVLRLHLELRRDWWPSFEREFRDYSSHGWASARRAERRS